MYKKIIIILAVFLFFTPFYFTAEAQSTDDAELVEFLEQEILRLQEIIFDLQERLLSLEEESLFVADIFNRYLERGMRGEDVENLQEFLAEDPLIYPEGLVTGYFGPLTESAVLRFQERNGLIRSGVLNLKTRTLINEMMRPKPEPEVEEEPPVEVVPDPVVDEVPDDEIVDDEADVGEYKLHPQPNYDTDEISLMVHNVVNEVREGRGLTPLVWDGDLASVSLKHSLDQAGDNTGLMDLNKPCAYPILRHEGFEFGLTVGDRLRNDNIEFFAAAENLVLFSGFDNLVYNYDPGKDTLQECENVEPIDLSSVVGEEEKFRILKNEIELRESLLEEINPVNWINREWKSTEDVASIAVEMWLNSPGHRDNVLNEGLERSGVGTAIVEGYFIITHVLAR